MQAVAPRGKQNGICFITRADGPFKAKKCRLETNYSLPTGCDLKQTPNGDRSELSLIRCKMHEPVSKNKIGSALVVTSFVPGT